MCFESSNNRYSRKVSCSFVFFKAELIQFDAYLLLSCGVFYTTRNVPGMVDTETHHKNVHGTCVALCKFFLLVQPDVTEL